MRKIPIPTLMAILCLLSPRTHSATGFDLSGGLGLMNLINLEAGYGIGPVAVTGYVGSSLFIGTSSLYLDANLAMGETGMLKIGAGPSTSSACGHGCGSATGIDARFKYQRFISPQKRYGLVLGMGCFIGKGNLFGSDPTVMPHFSVGFGWQP